MRTQTTNRQPLGIMSAIKTIRACVYVRVSSDEQVKKEFSIPQLQIPECIRLIKEAGWRFTKTYVDEGLDCNTFFKRTQLQKMLTDDLNDYDVVVVYSFDRLAGDDENTRGQIYSILDRNKKQITSVKQKVDIVASEDYDPKTLNIAQQRQINSFGVSWDRKIRRERFMDSRIKTVDGGKHIVEPCYGYKIIRKVNPQDDRRTIGYRTIDETEAPVLKRIFTERIEGKSVGKITDGLNKEGIKTRKGSTWSNTRIYQVLRNPFPAGFIVWNKTQHRKYGDDRILTPLEKRKWKYIPVNTTKEKYYKPIISKELFDRIQEITKRNREIMSSKAVGSANILGGLIKCPVCGKSLVETSIYWAKKLPYRRGFYICSDYVNKKECSNQRFRTWEIKEEVVSRTEKYLRDPQEFTKYQDEMKKEKIKTKEEELTAQRRMVKKIQERLYSLNMKYIDGKIKEDYYKEILSGLEKEEKSHNITLTKLEEEIKEYLDRKEKINRLKNFDKLLGQRLRDMDLYKQKQTLRDLITEITYEKISRKWQILFRV